MYQKSRGVVLHIIKYNDTSNIVDIYTELYGRMSFVVKRPRSRKAAVKSNLFQPLSIIEFDVDYKPTTTLNQIREAKTYLPFQSLPYNPYKSAISLFIAEFLYRALREEGENKPLFEYLVNSIEWLDSCEENFANFHLVFLMRLSRFLGLYPNVEDYNKGDYFDLLNANFTPVRPSHHAFIQPEEAESLSQLMRMNYETMYLFQMNRQDRNRILAIVNEYYRLHIPDFPVLKSIEVLQELFG